jgi:hypothetical protein
MVGDIHGNENVGGTGLDLLRQRLAASGLPAALAPLVSLVLVPVLNPDGVASNTRGNAAGVDLNRNFPTANNQSFMGMQPETQALLALMDALPPAAMISIHEPVGVVDPDGPVAPWEGALAAKLSLPLQGAAAAGGLPAYPGSLGTYLGVERNIPTATLELPRLVSTDARTQMAAALPDALLGAVASAAGVGP